MPAHGFTFPTLVTWTDPSGKVHIPPDPPLVQGYPPWFPRPNEYRRNHPMKRCPALVCRRTHHCAALLYGEFCQKTHMERESFRAKLVQRLDAITRSFGREPVDDAEVDPNQTPRPEMKRALQQRQDELMHEALLKWQTDWIAQQKLRFKRKTNNRFSPLNNHPLT